MKNTGIMPFTNNLGFYPQMPQIFADMSLERIK